MSNPHCRHLSPSLDFFDCRCAEPRYPVRRQHVDLQETLGNIYFRRQHNLRRHTPSRRNVLLARPTPGGRHQRAGHPQERASSFPLAWRRPLRGPGDEYLLGGKRTDALDKYAPFLLRFLVGPLFLSMLRYLIPNLVMLPLALGSVCCRMAIFKGSGSVIGHRPPKF